MIGAAAPSRFACRWWAGAAVVLTGVLLAQAETKALRSIGNDFTAYLEAAGALARGDNPYHVAPMFPYSYPLTLAWLLIPLCATPIWFAAATWFGVSVFAYWRVVNESACAADAVESRCRGVMISVVAAIVLLQIVQNELLNGQINLVVCALSLTAVALSERRQSLSSAMLWGAAIALKLFPLILGPWFLLRRRWTELIVGGAAAVAFALVPVLWTGHDAIAWTREYLTKIAGGEAGAIGVGDFIHLNVSRAIASYAGWAPAPAWLIVTTGIVLVGCAMAADWRGGLRDGPRRAVTFLALVVLLSPKSETHHMVFSIPAVIVLALRAHTSARVAALVALLVVFNVGYVTAAVRDPFLLVFAVSIAAWCMAE